MVYIDNTNDHLDPYFIHQIYINLLCTSVKISLDIPNVYLNLTELEVYDNYYQATFPSFSKINDEIYTLNYLLLISLIKMGKFLISQM